MKYPNVLQHNEEDCGAACLASISKYYGRTFTINRIREVAGTYSSGTTLLGLKQGAEALGFTALRYLLWFDRGHKSTKSLSGKRLN